ncbi:hypothetical protein [Janthinobacterium lividum]|uniref:hypothetical protein n=1 Tax=Janthinobacterium lividum TaxID=29581 RepID=UPI001B82E717|nr:hypothetical protein [Janthinobacterium lividum]MBR7634155.1 hypothetical protein [Janthinobacterium lividum]
MTTLRKAIILAVFFAVISAGAALSYAAPWTDISWRQALLWTGSFCCLGFLLGGIYAFDPDSDLKIKSSAIGRMSFGVIASLILSALWRWPLEGVALAGLIGAVLGYLGMMWAKFADF